MPIEIVAQLLHTCVEWYFGAIAPSSKLDRNKTSKIKASVTAQLLKSLVYFCHCHSWWAGQNTTWVDAMLEMGFWNNSWLHYHFEIPQAAFSASPLLQSDTQMCFPDLQYWHQGNCLSSLNFKRVAEFAVCTVIFMDVKISLIQLNIKSSVTS